MPKFISWIPTQPEYIEPFFELCAVSADDIVYDLGSGDGRLLFAAVEKGAGRCVGIDIDGERISVSQQAAQDKGMDGKVTFIKADVLEVNLAEATVILCYLYTSASAALRPKFEQELKPGTRVVMESFPVPGWKPAKVTVINNRSYYFYTIPAEKSEDYEKVVNTPVNYDYYDYY